jgi:ribosomal protein S27AE
MNDWLSHKIRFLANRVRCSRCNADSSSAVFVIGENIKFKIPIEIKDDYSPIFKKSGRMTINKYYQLISIEGLSRICTRCGKSRKTSIPNGFS